MGVVGLGVDVVHVPRVARLLAAFGDRFTKRFLHAEERCALAALLNAEADAEADARSGGGLRAAHFVASRWAVKEASYKALAHAPTRGLPRIAFTDMVLEGSAGPPKLSLRGRAASAADALGVKRCFVSVSHDGEYAFAQVILESG